MQVVSLWYVGGLNHCDLQQAIWNLNVLSALQRTQLGLCTDTRLRLLCRQRHEVQHRPLQQLAWQGVSQSKDSKLRCKGCISTDPFQHLSLKQQSAAVLCQTGKGRGPRHAE